MNYSKSSDIEAEFNSQKARIAAQQKRIDDLEAVARDRDRYSKLSAIASKKNIGNVDEHMHEVLEISDAEFDRYCKALSVAPDIADSAPPELYDDPSFNPDTDGGPDRYSRRGGKDGKKAPSADEISRYSRQAADIVAHKKHRGEQVGTVAEEMNTILVANGYPAISN